MNKFQDHNDEFEKNKVTENTQHKNATQTHSENIFKNT